MRENLGIDYFMSIIRKYPKLSREEELALVQKAKNGDKKAIDLIVGSNLCFVVKTAHKFYNYSRNGYYFKDLIQQGSIGILKAIKKFDPQKECRFLTYARYWIDAYIIAFGFNTFSMAKLGTGKNQKRLFVKRAEILNINEMDDDAEKIRIKNDLAKKLGVNVRSIDIVAKRFKQKDLYLEDKAYTHDDCIITHKDLLLVDSYESDVFKSELDLKVRNALELSNISDKEKDIIRKKYFEEDITFADIAQNYGFTKQRAQQLGAKAIKKLRKEFELQGITKDVLI